MNYKESSRGKRENQKLKPYAVLQILQKETDEDNLMTVPEIVGELATYGIDAERRSIYRDIQDINSVNLALKVGYTIDEAKEELEEDDTLKLVQYDASRKGYFVQRDYDLSDLTLLAECIYAAKFIPQKEAERLTNILCEFVSEYKADSIKHNAITTDRVKTLNKDMFKNLITIKQAMSKQQEGQPHTPEKITFNYLTRKVGEGDLDKLVEKKRNYKVSPYHLIINDGNYYLLAFDDNSQEIRTYRVDRMKNVKGTGEPRDGEKEFKNYDLSTFTQRRFGMFSGEKKKVEMTFTMSLLDTAIDRFGTKNAFYVKVDDHHFKVITDVEISKQFFAWISGFEKSVKIETPEVANEYKEFLDKIRAQY